MRYLVTGATGFIGRRLIHHLLDRGDQTTALVRDGRSIPEVRTTRGDLATGTGLPAAVDGAERVIHLAGVIKAASPRGYAEVNTEGTRRLCAALASLSQPPRLVYCSSLAASGPGRQRHEDDPPAPVSAYGRSKLGGEHAVREAAGRVAGVILRPPIVYGPGDREFLPRLVQSVRAGLLPAVGRPGPRHYSLIHVDDLCRALLAAADGGAPGEVYHVSDGIEHRWDHIGAAAATALGRPPPRVVHIPVSLAMAAARVGEVIGTSVINRDKVAEARHPTWTCSTEHTTGRLRFTPAIPLAEGLNTALAAYRRP